jgi:hypothetical protein
VRRAAAARALRPRHDRLLGYWELRLDSFNVPRAALTTASQKNAEAQAANDAKR